MRLRVRVSSAIWALVLGSLLIAGLAPQGAAAQAAATPSRALSLESAIGPTVAPSRPRPRAMVRLPRPSAVTVPSSVPANQSASAAQVADYARLPLRFEPNQGQTDRSVSFLAHGVGYTLYLTGDGATIGLMQVQTDTVPGARPRPRPFAAHAGATSAPFPTVRESVLRLRFVGANTTGT